MKRIILSLALPLLCCGVCIPARATQPTPDVAEFITAKGTGERLSPRPSLKLEPLAQPDESFPTVIVDTGKTFQTMVGIGGALTDASAEI
jgi:glucosylceramidase